MQCRYYDETDREFEMMQQHHINGPQRGRKSQHHNHRNKPGGHNSGRSRNAETELGVGSEYPSSSSAPSSPNPQQGRQNNGNNDPNTMESGFFNKYADDQQGDGRGGKTDQTEQQLKPVRNFYTT